MDVNINLGGARTIMEVALILGLIVLGGAELTEDKAMYCPVRNIAMNCDRTTATRCYYQNELDETKYKVCKEGWEPLKDLIVPIEEENVTITTSESSVSVTANGGKYNCDTDNGAVTSYTRCIKENGQEGYLGELV